VNGTPESINGGAGVDTLNTTAFGGNYLVNLTTGLTNFAGESFVNMENLIAGVGNDTLIGTAGNNLIDGGAGNDSITGNGGNDTVVGGLGNDTLTGGFGAGAAALGGDGNDLIFQVNGTPEFINGGAGVDTLNTTAFGGNYLVNLSTGLTNFAGESFVNMENLIAGVGNDTLIGTAGANTIDGGAGNDSVVGGFGNDSLLGGVGNDTLVGGFGRDTMVGGAGDDVFDFNATGESPSGLRDLISGFSFSSVINPNDKIDLSTIDANALLFGNQAFSTVEGTGIGQLSFANLANGNTRIRGNTDLDAFAELEIEVADGAVNASFWRTTLDFFL
jgi:Ca2+-binding RTX toxin-like protein